ncbi:hypothetical protein ACYPKM_04450 [Pseudomonas aeruginosa]
MQESNAIDRQIITSLGAPVNEYAEECNQAYLQLILAFSLGALGEVDSCDLLLRNDDAMACDRMFSERLAEAAPLVADLPHGYWRTSVLGMLEKMLRATWYGDLSHKLAWLDRLDSTLYEAICSLHRNFKPLSTVPLFILYELEKRLEKPCVYEGEVARYVSDQYEVMLSRVVQRRKLGTLGRMFEWWRRSVVWWRHCLR